MPKPGRDRAKRVKCDTSSTIKQDAFNVLQLALDWVEDAQTLFCVSVASSYCKYLVQQHVRHAGHCLGACVTSEMQRQQQRWQEHLRTSTTVGQDQKARDTEAWQVVNTKPLEWLCRLAGLGAMSEPTVSQAVLQQLSKCSHEVLMVLTRTLAARGLQLTDSQVIQAARQHRPWVHNLADALQWHGYYQYGNNNKKSRGGLTCLYSHVLLNEQDSIMRNKGRMKLEDFPSLMKVACTYGSTATLLALTQAAEDRTLDAEAKIKAAHRQVSRDSSGDTGPAGSGPWQNAWLDTLKELCESCIARDGCAKLGILVSTPSAHCLRAADALKLLRQVLAGGVRRADCSPTALLKTLYKIEAVKGIGAEDIYTTLLHGLKSAKAPPEALQWFLRLRQAQDFSTRQIITAVLAASRTTKYHELIDDLDDLLPAAVLVQGVLVQGVGRDATMRLVKGLVVQQPNTLQHFLNGMASVNLNAALTAGDLHTLLQLTIHHRGYDDALLIVQLNKTSQMTTHAVLDLIQLLIGRNHGPQRTNSDKNLKAIYELLHLLLELPTAQDISHHDGKQVLLSALDMRWYDVIPVLNGCAALKAGWNHISPNLLAPCLVEAFANDGFRHDCVIEDVINHPHLRHMSYKALAGVVTSGLSARARAKAKCSARTLAATQRGSEDAQPEQTTSEKASITRMCKLLSLPAIASAPPGIVYDWAVLAMKSESLAGLLTQLPISDFGLMLVLKLMQHPMSKPQSAQGVALLLQQVLPVVMPCMRSVDSTSVAQLMTTCILSDLGAQVLELLVQLPGAQELPASDIRGLIMLAGPPGALTELQQVLMWLPNAEMHVVCGTEPSLEADALNKVSEREPACQQDQVDQGDAFHPWHDSAAHGDKRKRKAPDCDDEEYVAGVKVNRPAEHGCVGGAAAAAGGAGGGGLVPNSSGMSQLAGGDQRLNKLAAKPSNAARMDPNARLHPHQLEQSAISRAASAVMPHKRGYDDDALLVALVVEYGYNWHFIADTCSSACVLQGGTGPTGQVTPALCKQRHTAIIKAGEASEQGAALGPEGQPLDGAAGSDVANLANLSKQQAKELITRNLPVPESALKRHCEAIAPIFAKKQKQITEDRDALRKQNASLQEPHTSHFKLTQHALVQSGGRILNPLDITQQEEEAKHILQQQELERK